MSDRWIGKSVPRVEDGRLLTGRGAFIDDHPPVANLTHAAIVRSPHAHARVRGYDVAAALAMEGVVGVITGADVGAACKPFGVGVTAPEPGAPILHDAVGSNLAGHRRLVYGDPDRAFAEADVVVRERFRFPKYGSTPIETYGVIARWDPIDEVLTIWSNFMGPFIMHPLVARVLQLPE